MDFGFWQAKVKFVMLDKEIPILFTGYKNQVSLQIDDLDSLVLNYEGPTSMPAITIVSRDMFSNKTKRINVPGSKFTEYFVADDTENLLIRQGKIYNENVVDEEFEDQIHIRLKKEKFKEIAGEDYEPTFYFSWFNSLSEVSLAITKKPVYIESIDLQYEQIQMILTMLLCITEMRTITFRRKMIFK